MNTSEMLKVSSRHTLQATVQVTRVVVNYSKEQKHWKKIALPWPDHLSKTDRTLKRSRSLLQASRLYSRSPAYFFCLRNGIESVCERVDKG